MCARLNRAAMMSAGHNEWAAQLHLDEQDASLFKNPECFLSVRCVAKSKTGKAFEAGVRNLSRSRSVAQISGYGRHR